MVDTSNWFEKAPKTRQRTLLASQRRDLYLEVAGQQLLNFSANDYLGLSQHPKVCDAVAAHVRQFGLGSGASRLVSGDDPLLHTFEAELAAWKGFESCLLVGSGMLANIGLIQALADRHTHVFADKLNHASLVDGVRLSGAKSYRYPHLDLDVLEQQLHKFTAKKRIIISDGVFSMDGDAADAKALLQLAEKYDAILLIDDAHGTGTVGKDGKGLLAQANISGHTSVIEVGTLGKAFGSYGAYVLGSTALIEGLRQNMRTFIYSTALPVSVVVGAQQALNIMQQGTLIQQLQDNVNYFLNQAHAFNLMPSQTPIQPVLLGSDKQALKAAERLREQGFFVPAIRPPTVPEGQSRLRITLSALHTKKHIDQLLEALS